MIFNAVSSFASWSKLVGSRDDDFIDRINHIYSVIILIIFSIVVTGGTYIGKAIACWIPKEADSHEEYVDTVCWTGPTYYVSHADNLATGRQAVIHYYLWVPIILLFQAFMFKIPNILWQMCNRGSGMNLDKISTLAEKTQMESESHRNETIEHIGNYIDRWITANKRRSKNIIARIRPRRGTYLTTVFFVMKLLYCVNAISQFFVLGLLLRMDFAKYGLKVSEYVRSDTVMMDEYIFPRTVYCDFTIRQLHNNLNLTTQCVLPINVLNEKVFIFLWFWFCLVCTMSILNLIQWIYRIVSKRSYVNYIFRYINIHEESLTKADKQSCSLFAKDYLNSDVIMLLRVVGKNSTDLVVADLLGYLWSVYKRKCDARILDAVSSFLSWSKFVGNHNDDFIDRVNHIYTVIVLTIFSIVVTGGTYIGDSISCWLPREATGKQRFVETTCWTGTTYHVDDGDDLSTGKVTVVHYYLWVPIILLFQAFLFKVPNIIWQMTNKASGMNLDKISTLSEKTQMESEDHRLETIEHIGNYIERWILANKQKGTNMVSRFRPKPGTYLTSVFFFTKLLYCINVICQFYIVGALMKINFAEYGLKVSAYIERDNIMMDPTVFPRVVYCNFRVRQLHNVLNMTTQCVLPINVLNEKVFMFLWFWFCMVSTLSIINMLHWVYRILSKGSYIDYIFRYININEQTLDKADRKACGRFVNRFLNLDVVMLLRVVGQNSTDLVVADLLGYLWAMYKKKCQSEETKLIDA